MPSITEIFLILEQYKYWVIFPVVVFEGPIITILSGFLVSLGVLGGVLSYVLLLIGDVLGDIMFYFIGKYSRTFSLAKKITTFLGYTEEREKFLQRHFDTHAHKTFLVAKFSQGVGSTVQMTAGMTGFDLRRYIWISIVGTIPKTFILMLIGYYMGGSYIKINEYLDSVALASVSVLIIVILYFIAQRQIKTFLSKKKD